MQKHIVIPSVLYLSLTMLGLGLFSTNSLAEKNVVLPQSVQIALDSLVTKIAPIQEEYGVGQVNYYTNNTCTLESASEEAIFGAVYGAMRLVWVIWDVTVIPQDAEIVSVEIQHELDPIYHQEGLKYWYRRANNLYMPPPECMDAYSELRDGIMYLEVEMGDTTGTRHYSLGDSATVDLANAVTNQNHFSICISFCEWSDGTGIGLASIPGWSVGGPELIVTWREEVGVSEESWGAIKRLHPR